MGFVDLHSHSTASDGTFAPAEVVRLAKSAGLTALALTDHDTVGGIAEAQAEAARIGIDFLVGIEISAEFPDPGRLHILGYGVDPNSPVLAEMMKLLVEGRDNRNPRIIARLQELGVAITMREVMEEAMGKTQNPSHKPIGRPHIAAVLLRKGYVSSIKQAFDKYLAPGGLAYFDKERQTPRQAIERIQAAGGIAVVAHPVQLHTQSDAQLERIIKDLADMGLEGIEVIHSDHTAALVEKYTRLADRFGLLKTGGSDFHGSNKKDIQMGRAGAIRVPREFYDQLRKRLEPAHRA